MSIEKVLSGIEHFHAFTRAVLVGNPREFLQAEKEDQEMAEACRGKFTMAPYDDPQEAEKAYREAIRLNPQGAVAAFLSIRREFIGQPETVKKIFSSSATDL